MSIIAYESFNGYNLQLIKEKGEIWFPAIQVAKALGYAEPKAAVYNIIKRNPEDFQENTLVTNLVTQGQNRSIRLLNEQGIYVICDECGKYHRSWDLSHMNNDRS